MPDSAILDSRPPNGKTAWLRSICMGALLVAGLFAVSAAIEQKLFRTVDVVWFRRLHLIRGVLSAALVCSWAVWYAFRIWRRYDEALAVARKALEKELVERTRALGRAHGFAEQILEALRERLFLIDDSGHVVKANRAACDAARTPFFEVGQPCTMLGAACLANSESCVARQALGTGQPVLDAIREDPANGRIYSVDAFPLVDEDGRTLVLEAVRDITVSRRTEAQLRHQEKMAALGLLAAGIAHDIGNPLAAMSAEIDLLEGESRPEIFHASLAVLRDQLDRIARTVREMSGFSRRRREAAGAVTIPFAVEDVVRLVRHDPRARNVRIETQLAPDLPDLWMVEDHFVLVLVNLAINAFDAMPKGGTLVIAGRALEDGVVMTVADDGTGMTDETLRHAGEPLFTTKAARGTGLGLSVCRDVLKAVGGTLTLSSQLGKGTTVTLRFPARALAAQGETRVA